MKSAGLRNVVLALAGAGFALALGLAGNVPPGAGSAHAQQGQAGRSTAATPAGIQGSRMPGVTAPATAPGGLPASFGSAGRSPGSTPISDDRSPDEAGADTAPRQPSSYTAPGSPQNSSACADVLQGFGNTGQRMAGVNGDRLRQAGIFLHPDVDQAREVQVLKLLLASFQEELQKRSPDLTLAGTYLGVAADLPITEEMVAQLADSLCVPVRNDQAASIAHVAEVQRQKTEKDRAR